MRPSPAEPLRERLARRANRPLVLLAVSAALVLAAAVQANRAARASREMAEALLGDYAEFAAFNYARATETALDSVAWILLGPVMHEFPHQGRLPHPATLVHYWRFSGDEKEGTHRPPPYPPSAYFGYPLGRDTLWAVRNALGDAHDPWRIDSIPRLSPQLQALMRDSVLSHLRAAYRPGDRYAYLQASADGERLLVGYTLMPTELGDTILYGFVMDRADYVRGLGVVFDRAALLPPAVTGNLPNRGAIRMRVTAADGGLLFASDEGGGWSYAADDQLSPRIAGLRVRAAIRPEMAGRLVIGGLPRSRLPFLLGLTVVACALGLVAVGQLRREGELARLRADFVASVSHELRTPLAQVRLFVETLMLGRARTEEQRRWALENIDRETTRLSHLVENVLLASRAARGGGAALPLRPADLSAEVQLAVAAFEPLAAARRAVLRARLEPGIVAALHADSFRQVMLNLLDNAVKYGPPGQTVDVSVARAGGGARVEVADQGPGVPAGDREAVWSAFFRGRGPGVRAVGGSGIGLSIVREVVEGHGGRAWVEDAPGGGARFVVLLPAQVAETASADGPASPAELNSDAETRDPAGAARG